MNVRVLRRALNADFLAQRVLSDLQLALFVIGSLFWLQAHTQDEAFSADLYGAFALQFPAEFWALAMMAPASMIWVGLRVPVKQWMVAFGAGLMTLQFLALGYSAIATGGEQIIGFFCTVLWAPLYLRMTWEALHAGVE